MSKRVVLVTGAARGLGAAIATRFHEADYRVALADIAIDAAETLSAQLSADSSSACALKLDVTSKADFEAARDALVTRWGRVDVLVNNAGASEMVPVMEITAAQFDRAIDINLRSVLFGCQVFGEYFARNGVGRIVNVASLAGQNGGSATGAHYAAAKGGAITLTKVFARDLAARGVTVNAIAPGPLDLPVVCTRACRQGSSAKSSRIFLLDVWAQPRTSPRPRCCWQRRTPTLLMALAGI
jgi:3-oxoacyl-[acyl-carrier protein] reductase